MMTFLTCIQYRSKVSWQSRLETLFSILEVFENWESIFDFQGSRIEFQGSSFETLEEFFEDLEQRFRGNDLILENKQYRWTKQLTHSFVRPNLLWNVCKYSFVLCIFWKACGSVSTLKLVTFQPYAFIALPAGASEFFFLCVTTTWREDVVFICVISTGRQNVNKWRNATCEKICFSLRNPPDIQEF